MLSNRALNEVRGGYSHYGFANNTLVTWSKHWQAPRRHQRLPAHHVHGLCRQRQRRTRRGIATRRSGRFATTSRMSYDAKGHHDLKLGGEFVRHFEDSENCAMCGGNDRRPQRHRSRGSAAVAVPRSVQCGHVELRGDVAVHAHLYDRHRRVPEPVRSAQVRRLGAG